MSMDEEANLIESYYVVANDMKARAECLLRCADTLARMADAMSADRIRRFTPSPPTESAPETP